MVVTGGPRKADQSNLGGDFTGGHHKLDWEGQELGDWSGETGGKRLGG